MNNQIETINVKIDKIYSSGMESSFDTTSDLHMLQNQMNAKIEPMLTKIIEYLNLY